MNNINDGIEEVVRKAKLISIPKLDILDVTLRDGGFLTGFSWPETFVKDFVATLVESGLRQIEIGYIGGVSNANGWYNGCTTSINVDLLAQLKTNHPEAKLFCMINPWRMRESQNLKELGGAGLYGVRIAYSTPHEEKVWSIVRQAVDAKLDTTLNLTSVSKLSFLEIEAAISKSLDIGIDSVSIADTTSSLTPDMAEKIYTILEKLCGNKLRLGFHGHDFLGFGMSNALVALSHGAAVIDGSIIGLGRGGANLRTELLSLYLYVSGDTRLNHIKPILSCMSMVADYTGLPKTNLLPAVCACVNVSAETFEMALSDSSVDSNEIAMVLAERLRVARGK